MLRRVQWKCERSQDDQRDRNKSLFNKIIFDLSNLCLFFWNIEYFHLTMLQKILQIKLLRRGKKIVFDGTGLNRKRLKTTNGPCVRHAMFISQHVVVGCAVLGCPSDALWLAPQCQQVRFKPSKGCIKFCAVVGEGESLSTTEQQQIGREPDVEHVKWKSLRGQRAGQMNASECTRWGWGQVTVN